MIEPGFDGENDPLIPYIKSQRFPVEEFFDDVQLQKGVP